MFGKNKDKKLNTKKFRNEGQEEKQKIIPSSFQKIKTDEDGKQYYCQFTLHGNKTSLVIHIISGDDEYSTILKQKTKNKKEKKKEKKKDTSEHKEANATIEIRISVIKFYNGLYNNFNIECEGESPDQIILQVFDGLIEIEVDKSVKKSSEIDILKRKVNLLESMMNYINLGGGKSKGDKKVILVAPTTVVRTSNSNRFADFPGLHYTLELEERTFVHLEYNIALGCGGTHFLAKMYIDDRELMHTRAIVGNTPYGAISATHDEYLEAGKYHIKVMYRTPGSLTCSVSNNDWQSYSLKIVLG